MRGTYIAAIMRNAQERSRRDAQTASDLYENLQALLQNGDVVTYGVAQITGAEYRPGSTSITVYCSGAQVTLQRETLGFYELQQQVNRLLAEKED